MALTDADRTVNERTTFKYAFTIADEDGNAVGPSDLDTFTLTLYDVASGTIINSREGQNALNANQVEVRSDGNVYWNSVAADNPILNSGVAVGEKEKHIALFEWTFNRSGSGIGAGSHELILLVLNVGKVP